MTKKSIKKIVISILAISLVAFVATKTFASDSILDDINKMRKNTVNNTASVGNENVQDIPEVPEENTTDDKLNVADEKNNTPKEETKENTNKNNAPTTTPYTGIGDYSTYIFIAVFAVSAVYAYKKVREYNN